MARSAGPRNAADDFLDQKATLVMPKAELFERETSPGAQGHKPDLIQATPNNAQVFVRRGLEEATIYESRSGKMAKVSTVPARSDGSILVSPTTKRSVDNLTRSLPSDWSIDRNWGAGPRTAPVAIPDLKNLLGASNYDALEAAGIFSKMAEQDPNFFASRQAFLTVWNEAIAGATVIFNNYDAYFGPGKAFELDPKENHFALAQKKGRDWDAEDILDDVDVDDLTVVEDTRNKKSLAVTPEGDRLFLLDWKESDAQKWELKELDIGEISGEHDAITGMGTDPNDRFIFVARGRTLSVIDHKTDPAIEVGSIKHPNPRLKFEGHIHSDGAGHLKVGDSKGHLWAIDSDDYSITGDDTRKALAKGIKDLGDVERVKVTAGADVRGALDASLEATQDKLLAKYQPDIRAAMTFKDIRELRVDVEGFKRDTLLPTVGDQRLVDTSVMKIVEAINQREKDIAQAEADELFLALEDQINRATSFEDAEAVRSVMEERVKTICQDVSDQNLWTIVRSTVLRELKVKEEKIGVKAIEKEQRSIRDALANIKDLPIPSLVQLRVRAEQLERRARSTDLKAKDLATITTLTAEVAQQSLEILRRDEEIILKGLDTVVGELKLKLEKVTTPAEFDRWLNNDLPLCREQLAGYQLVIPVSHERARKKIITISGELSKTVVEAKAKFDADYAKTRTAVVEHSEEKAALAEEQIDELLAIAEAKVNKKEFKDAQDAQAWIEAHQAMVTIEKLISEVESKLPDKGKVLRRKLKSSVSQLVFRVDRLNEMMVDEATGAQMYPFGKVFFPIWEQKLAGQARVAPPRVELTIKPLGEVSGLAPSDRCELILKITDPDGNQSEVPFYANDLRKYGLLNDDYDGQLPSYVTVKQARKIVQRVQQMDSTHSAVRQEYDQFQSQLKSLSSQLKALLDKKRADDNSVDADIERLKGKRTDLLNKYMTFVNDNGLYAWYKLKGVQSRTKQALVEKNGELQGAVPNWQWYWTVDEATEKGLEDFARESARQLRLKAGIVSLEGHPGTGKDVIIDMFCNKTKRPKFTFDCSKWSTEYDLSETVQFKTEEGATETVLVPSIVVEALRTPGAVLYFNEFNALPLQTQIFLHSLFDAKRQITLKTSKETVPAEDGVLICGSLNPNYPGTNTPQAATRDRMVIVPVGYPTFERQDASKRIIGYEASEALRIARSTKSLEDLTEEQNLKKNEFVQLWEEYINKRNTSDPRLTSEREYDMDVIFALVQFTNEIRKAFITKIEGTAQGPDEFELSQPFTGRGLRTCADYISHDITKAMKTKGAPEYVSPETMAKNLLRRYYLPYIVDGEQKQKFIQKLDTEWTMTKP